MCVIFVCFRSWENCQIMCMRAWDLGFQLKTKTELVATTVDILAIDQ